MLFRVIVSLILPVQGWILVTLKTQGEHLVRIETEVKAITLQVVQLHQNVDDLMVRTYHLERNKP